MSELDINELLDATLDDLADVPAFAILPVGSHIVSSSAELKEVNDKPVVELSFILVEHVELDDPEEALVEGTECNAAFFLATEFGQGNFKEIAIPLGAALGVSKLRDVIEAWQDIEVAVVTTQRADKNDKTKKYMQIKTLTVV